MVKSDSIPMKNKRQLKFDFLIEVLRSGFLFSVRRWENKKVLGLGNLELSVSIMVRVLITITKELVKKICVINVEIFGTPANPFAACTRKQEHSVRGPVSKVSKKTEEFYKIDKKSVD